MSLSSRHDRWADPGRGHLCFQSVVRFHRCTIWKATLISSFYSNNLVLMYLLSEKVDSHDSMENAIKLHTPFLPFIASFTLFSRLSADWSLTQAKGMGLGVLTSHQSRMASRSTSRWICAHCTLLPFWAPKVVMPTAWGMNLPRDTE